MPRLSIIKENEIMTPPSHVDFESDSKLNLIAELA